MAAQPPKTSSWIGAQLPVHISNHWQWHNDAGYRTIGTTASAYQYLYRTEVRYSFNKNWSTTAGVALFFTRSTYEKKDHEFRKEFRVWEEINFNNTISKKIIIQHRLRIEERRFAPLLNKVATTALRFRYRIAATQILSSKWSLQLYNEYMHQESVHKFSFNQNRLGTTASYAVNSSFQVQGGYMWLQRKTFSQHNLLLSFQKNIHLKKTKEK